MPKFKTPMSKQAQSLKSKSLFENMLLLFCFRFLHLFGIWILTFGILYIVII